MIKYNTISEAKMNNLTGQKIGKLTVIGISETRNKYNRIMWDCVCDCGNKKSIPADMLNKTLRGQIGTKSCGCLRNNSHNKIKNRESALWKQLYNSSVLKKENYRIKKGWVKSDINFEHFKYLCKSKCFYCGEINSNVIKDIRGEQVISDAILKYNGIDRRDSSIGYTKENTVPCCKNCNRAKNDMTYDAFFEWVKTIYEYNFK